jgi:DUF177 domain-containing protein
MLHRPLIDGMEFARSGARLSGDWPVADFPRLQGVVRAGTTLHYELQGIPEGLGRPALRLHATGTLHLTCQRCLDAFEHLLEVEALLLLFGSESDLAAVPVDPEGPDCIVATKEMAVRDLIEEEVLLAIPYAPRHDGCRAGAGAAGAPRTRPFADLRARLGTKH